MADGSEQAPAGWYDDPHAPGRMRYFDGREWTNHFHEPGKLPDVGTWTSTTVSALMAHWPGAMVIAFIGGLVANLVTWFLLRRALQDVSIINDEFIGLDAGSGSMLFVVGVVNAIWAGLTWLALSRYMQRAHLQATPTIGDAYAHALRRFPQFAGVLVLLVATIFGAAVLLSVVGVVSASLAVLLLLVMAVLAVWACVKVAFVVSAVVAAPKSESAIATSAAISRGRFWPVFGRLLLVIVVPAIASTILGTVMGKFGSVLDAQAASEMFDESLVRTFNDTQLRDLFPSTTTMLIAIVVTSIIGAATTAIAASGLMRIYLDSGAPHELG